MGSDFFLAPEICRNFLLGVNKAGSYMCDFCRLFTSFIRKKIPFIYSSISTIKALLPTDLQFLQGVGESKLDSLISFAPPPPSLHHL